MNNSFTHNKLKALANLLLERSLYKEADEIFSLADLAQPDGFKKEALEPFTIGLIIAGVAALATAIYSKASEGAKDIISDITDDFEAEVAEDLFEKWYAELAQTDLIDGLGSFPEGDPMGGAFMRNFIKKTWNAKDSMTVSEFEAAFDEYYGESAASVFDLQFGLDNEDGWVESYNLILKLWKAQDTEKDRLIKEREGDSKKGDSKKEDSKKEDWSFWGKDGPPAGWEDSKASVLKKGDRGSKVESLQQSLIDAGHSVGSHGADGIFGGDTADAVISFKESMKQKKEYDGPTDSLVTSKVLDLLSSKKKA